MTLAGWPAVLVSEKVALSDPALAVTVYEPMVEFAVAVTLATPDEFVTALLLESDALAPDGGAEKVTVTPLSRLPFESFTVACRAVANWVLTGADCGVPPVAVRAAGAPAVLERANVALSEPTLAVTEYDPTVLFAVAVTLAWPSALVTAEEPESAALGPELGAAKFTVTPLMGFPFVSFTITSKGSENGLPAVVDCGVPLVAATLPATGSELVRENEAVKAP